jgi:hypothetical protein
MTKLINVGPMLPLLVILACQASPVEPKVIVVEITREVPVTTEAAQGEPVTVVVEKELPVTREVPVTVEVTRLVEQMATARAPSDKVVVTYQVLEPENFKVWYKNITGGDNELELYGQTGDPRFEITLTVAAGFSPFMMVQPRDPQRGSCATCRVLLDGVEWRRSQACGSPGLATCSRY